MIKQQGSQSSSLLKSSICFTIVFFFSISAFVLAQSQPKPPYDKDRLIEVVQLNALTTKEIVEAINGRGVNFKVTPDVEAEFRQAGARPELIDALKKNYRPPANKSTGTNPSTSPSSKPAPAVPPGPPLSKTEIVNLLKGGTPSERVEQIVDVRGVNFTPTPDTSREIAAAGGSRSLLGTIALRATTKPPSPPPNNPSNPPRTTIDKGGPSAPDYDDLNYQAIAAMKANNAAEATRLLQQAIRAEPSKPLAYKLMGFVQIYGYRNIAGAEQNFRASLERDGAAVFQVYHDHTGTFQTYCQGALTITRTGVAFKGNDGKDAFEVTDDQIKEVSLNDLVGARFGGFHIKVREGQKGKSKNFNFAPATQQASESNLIINLIRSY
ncbi:MAG TPA: hypothetical protein VID27_05965 [Blastocatellia bacterium]|jgi:hypothetical protein